jgi:hypothetical protein
MALLYSNIQLAANCKLEHLYVKKYYIYKLLLICYKNNTVIVTIFLIMVNQQVTKAHSMLVGTSEHIRLLTKYKKKGLNE